MGRRTRLAHPASRYPAGEVTSASHVGRPGWSLAQARAVLAQGYSVEQTERLTGWPAVLLLGRRT